MTRLLLACLCLGAGQPVSAQTPPGWSITLTSARGEVGAATGGGTTIAPPTHFPIFSYLGATSVTYHLTGVGNGNGTGPGAKCSVTANDTLTLTVTGTWNGPGAAPSSVPILESSSANYWANGQTGGTLVADSQMASDGLGDPAVSTGLCSGVSRGKHLITVPVQGNTWTFDRTISAVSNCTDTMPVGAGAMAGGVGLGDYTVQIDNRSVAISCPSMDSPFANNLANNYYKGSQDILHGTDRYQHPRLPRGNSVDSVAYTLNDPLTGQQFVAASTYYSGATGFISPTFVWSISGDGTPDANTLAYMNPSLTNPNGVVNLPANVKFGSTWNAATKRSNRLTVTVKDSDQATATDTYSVAWHTPEENFSLISYRKNVPKLVGLPQPITLNASAPSNLSIPGQEGEIDWGDVKQKSGLPVAVGGTAAGGLLLIPEVASGPYGWAIIVAQSVAAAGSYYLGTSSPDHPGTVPIQGNADYKEYFEDLKHQVTTSTDPAYSDNMTSFQPTTLAAQAYAASSTDPSKWSTDPYFMGCTATWQGGWYTDIKDMDGEGYDVNGYTGHVFGHTEIPVALFKHFVWTCTYVKPPTN